MPIVRCELTILAAPERCFDLARSVNLHADSSADIGGRAVGGRQSGLSDERDTTTWSARFFGLRFRMEMRTEACDRPTEFRDVMTRGTLRRFAHQYRFEPRPDGGCVLSDELEFAAPFGLLGRLVERFYLARRMEHLVRRRLTHIKSVAEGDGWRRYLAPPV